MLEIFLFAVFSYCTFKLAIKRIDKSIIIFCILIGFGIIVDEVYSIGLGFLWLSLYLLLNQYQGNEISTYPLFM